jgi:hypothetical protein
VVDFQTRVLSLSEVVGGLSWGGRVGAVDASTRAHVQELLLVAQGSKYIGDYRLDVSIVAHSKPEHR